MEEIKLTAQENQLIVSAFAEATQASREFQDFQNTLQQKREAVVAAGKVAEKVYKTVMILKNLNPDGFTIAWDEAKGEVTIKPKEISSPEPSQSPRESE